MFARERERARVQEEEEQFNSLHFSLPLWLSFDQTRVFGRRNGQSDPSSPPFERERGSDVTLSHLQLHSRRCTLFQMPDMPAAAADDDGMRLLTPQPLMMPMQSVQSVAVSLDVTTPPQLALVRSFALESERKSD